MPSSALPFKEIFARWEGVFADPIMATAILDQLLHHSHTINICGDSYKLKVERAASPGGHVPVPLGMGASGIAHGSKTGFISVCGAGATPRSGLVLAVQRLWEERTSTFQ
jgi:hypothetical protein